MNDDNVISMITALLLGVILGMFIGAVMTSAWYDKFDKFCPECGHQYRAEVEYCSHDGYELKMIGEEEEEKKEENNEKTGM